MNEMMTEFCGNLACPFEFGQALTIVGKTIDGASRFHINLRTSKPTTSSSNIGFRFSCYFRDDIIIRNSMINGEWGEEETSDNLNENTAPNPIVPGDFFIICIFASDEKFHISINNRAYCTFNYRLPLNSIRALEIVDHIQVIKQVDHRSIYPSAWPPIQSSDFGKAFSNDIPILFSPGHVIVITARCFDNRKGQFIIKFFDGDSKREELHFNARFDQKVVVRNGMKKNFDFGPEEREGRFPFIFDEQFQLAIGFTEKEFLFAINGKPFPSFSHRTLNVLQSLSGFKITCINGLRMHVSGVDHIQMGDPKCIGIENYSRHDVDII